MGGNEKKVTEVLIGMRTLVVPLRPIFLMGSTASSLPSSGHEEKLEEKKSDSKKSLRQMDERKVFEHSKIDGMKESNSTGLT